MEVLLNKKNTDSCLLHDALNGMLDIKDDGRLNAFGRFVQKQELGFAEQGTGNSELLLLAAAEIAAAASGAEDAEERLRAALKRIDKAATKGVIHKNQAARRKSRLTRRIAADGES